MEEIFREYSVKVRKTPATRIRLILTWVIGLIVIAGLLVCVELAVGTVYSVILLIAAAFAAYATWWVAAWAKKKEFEYSLTSHYLTVDKIIANRKRYPVASIDLKTIETFGKFSEKEHDLTPYNKKVFAVGGEFEDYYITLHHQKHGHSILIISCDEEMLEGILTVIPREIARKSGLKNSTK